jgi:hypothetical protein
MIAEDKWGEESKLGISAVRSIIKEELVTSKVMIHAHRSVSKVSSSICEKPFDDGESGG